MAETGHRYVSRPAPVREDRRFVAGRGRFVADISPPGVLHVALVASPHAHAHIEGIGAQSALELDGVVDVVTGAELAGETDPLRQYLDLPEVVWRPLANGDARYAGEWVAAVVADSRALAEDGAELVEVEYEPLDVVIDPEVAMRDGTPLVHPRHGTNVFVDRTFEWGDVGGDFERAGDSTRVRVRWNRSSTVPLETFGVVASWDEGSEILDVWASIQMPQFPEQVAAALRLPLNRVRVHFDVDVGGSFGVKRGIKHGVLAGYLSRRLGRPVKLIEDRQENMHGGDFHGPDRIFDVELAHTRDGQLLSMKLHAIDDEGAYPGRSPLQLAKPIGSIVGPYTIGSVEYRATGVATNKTGQVAVRGFGQSPTNYAIESAVDAVARRLGIDRAELRRRNFPRPDQFPYRIPSGTSYDSGDYPAVLDKALDTANVPALERRRDELRAGGRLAGIGIATCLEPGGGNAIFENVMNPKNDKTTFPEGCRLRIDGTGAITAVIAISSAGQGHDTLVATLTGEELGRDPSAVAVLRTDSAGGLPSQSPVGSRMAIMLGAAVRGAALVLKEKLVAIAAHVLEADPADLVYDAGDVMVRGNSARRVDWYELVDIAHRRSQRMPEGMQPGLEAVYVAQVPGGGMVAAGDGSVQMYPTFSFEAHVILVSVDPGTGLVEFERYGLAHDCGTVINPHIVDGMVYGGVAHGIGVALHERFAFDENGQPLTTSFMDYLLPSAHEVPHIELQEHCTPSPLTSLGQKGVGEAGYMGAPAAVASAVNDALAPVGASIHSLPMTPSDIWAAVRAAAAEEVPDDDPAR
jgi:CO/xanthine dehydrogenase Mo-binding subunit